MDTIVPVFKVSDARASAEWYAQLGFEVIGEHQFEPGFPLYMFLRRGDVYIHLSEHAGDAPKASLAYLYTDDVDELAARLGAVVEQQPWGREFAAVDPDGNRVRIGSTGEADEA